MTMISFRADDADVAQADEWARRLRIDRSDLLRDALRRHLAELAGHPDATGEEALASVADWGPAEDWSDWADATR